MRAITKEFENYFLKITINFKKDASINPNIIKDNVYDFLEKHKFTGIEFSIEFDEGCVILLFKYDDYGNVWRTVLSQDLEKAIHV
ncbi:hypothetical protein HJ167_20470 [Vibrio parahaemolyticus]|uniref:hypothetical protein n=1 Tax=Vibrio fluvialis TaxID=676 RepID=UPI00056FEED4|nr:hypothetical protein [Vibrio fluvialis]MBE4779973.1 hypothetical protein [Vibrio parahaemolyticus]